MSSCSDTPRLSARLAVPGLFTALFLALAVPTIAHASRYRVDVILFTDNAPVTTEQPTPLGPLAADAGANDDVNAGISVDDTAALAAHGITLLPGEDSTLGREWRGLRYSQDFQPVVRLSWIQTQAASGTAIHITHGVALAGSDVPPIDGNITLHIGTLLHLEAHFRYSYVNGNGAIVSYKLNETRRVRFDELHYIDSPRLGILARVSKVQ